MKTFSVLASFTLSNLIDSFINQAVFGSVPDIAPEVVFFGGSGFLEGENYRALWEFKSYRGRS